MPNTDCMCNLIPETANAGPALMICHHFSNEEVTPIMEQLDTVMDQFAVAVNPELSIERPLRDQLEQYFADVWETTRNDAIEQDEEDPGAYRPEYLDGRTRLTLTISFMRYLSVIAQYMMGAITELINDPDTVFDTPEEDEDEQQIDLLPTAAETSTPTTTTAEAT